jgi:predicted metal-dependent peptidase
MENEVERILQAVCRGPLQPLQGVIRVLRTRQVDTAAITERGLLAINPSYYLSLKEEERVGLIAHEVLHLARGHFARARRAGVAGLRANIAADLEVNGILHALGYSLPQGVLLEEELLSLEEWLQRMQKQEQEQNNGGNNEGKNGQQQPGQPKQGSREQVVPNDLLPKEEQEKLEKEYEKKKKEGDKPLQTADAVGRIAGRLPSESRRLVEALRSSKGLAEKIRKFLEETSAGDSVTLLKPPMPCEIFAHKAGIVRTAIIVDSSGSMSELLPEAVKCAREVYSSLSAHSPVLASWDTGLVQEYSSFPREFASSRGGTAMDESIPWAASKGCEQVIVLTDGFTPWRDEHVRRAKRVLVICLVPRGSVPTFEGKGAKVVYWEV